MNPRSKQSSGSTGPSEQALSILQQFFESGGTSLFYRDWGEGRWTLQVDNVCQIGVTEPPYIQDDLDELASMGLLRRELGPDGNYIYHVTRRARELLDMRKRSQVVTATEDLARGQPFGQWTLVDPIGQGGNGLVWSAKNSNGQIVAIKFLQPEFYGKQREQRFRHEVEFLRREKHRLGLLPLIDSSLPETSGIDRRPWFATPFAECFSKLSLAGAEHLELLVRYMADVAQTLADLHDEDTWHRDLKPDNLFLLDGNPVIGDFGLVHFPEKESNTRETENLGSRNYTAPELEGDAVGTNAAAADVFSIAKTIWVLGSGRRNPPQGQLQKEIAELRFSTLCPHPRAYVLDALLERSTQHSAFSRPRMREFLNELMKWLNPPSVPALSSENQNIFKTESRTHAEKEQLILSAKAALESCDPVLKDVANRIHVSTNMEPLFGFGADLQLDHFVELCGGLRLKWRGARDVRVTVGDVWTVYLQTFVLVEAIEDGTLRIVAGHYVDTTAHGERFFRGVNKVWRKEIRDLREKSQIEKEVDEIRVGLFDYLGRALEGFAERIRALPERR